MDINDYDLIKQIGKGSHGKVYKAVNFYTNKLVAIKTINIRGLPASKIDNIKTEIETMKKLSYPECNPFIVCYYDSQYNADDQEFVISMEYIEGKDMSQFLKHRSKNDEEYYYYLLLITRDIAMGLDYVHKKGILHNDIKPANIMIQKDTYIPKLIDFGLACNLIHDKRYPSEYCLKPTGTPLYLAPEYFQSNKGFKLPASDMWSLGVTLYKTATGNDVYKAKTYADLVKEVKDFHIPKLNTSNELLNTITNGLLRRNPNDRLKPYQIIELIDANIVKPKSLAK